MSAAHVAPDPVPPGGAAGPVAPARLTLRNAQRIRSPEVFRGVLDSVAPLIGRYMVLRVVRGEGAVARLGIITSRKTFHRAVERSRARRLLREAFRLHQRDWPPGSEMVVIGRRNILAVGTEAVGVEMRRLMDKAGRGRRDGTPSKGSE